MERARELDLCRAEQEDAEEALQAGLAHILQGEPYAVRLGSIEVVSILLVASTAALLMHCLSAPPVKLHVGLGLGRVAEWLCCRLLHVHCRLQLDSRQLKHAKAIADGLVCMVVLTIVCAQSTSAGTA